MPYTMYCIKHVPSVVPFDFDTTETRFEFDSKGQVAGIVPVVRQETHRIIEECMLAANVAAARYLLRNKQPALYRVHERPSAAKLTDLAKYLSEMGLTLTGGTKPTAKDYADLLNQARGRTDFPVIQVMLLRSMMQAVYTSNNSGHFGLAFPAYAHFTSPIRRYPDLMVHRAIKQCIASDETTAYSAQAVAAMGESLFKFRKTCRRSSPGCNRCAEMRIYAR